MTHNYQYTDRSKPTARAVRAADEVGLPPFGEAQGVVRSSSNHAAALGAVPKKAGSKDPALHCPNLDRRIPDPASRILNKRSANREPRQRSDYSISSLVNASSGSTKYPISRSNHCSSSEKSGSTLAESDASVSTRVVCRTR